MHVHVLLFVNGPEPFLGGLIPGSALTSLRTGRGEKEAWQREGEGVAARETEGGGGGGRDGEREI